MAQEWCYSASVVFCYSTDICGLSQSQLDCVLVYGLLTSNFKDMLFLYQNQGDSDKVKFECSLHLFY